MHDPLHQIRDIHQRWLEGSLAQEDALFEIGDVLETWVPIVDEPAAIPDRAKSSS